MLGPDICDMSQIYHSTYEYGVPQKVVAEYLSGKAFDHPVPYTADETGALHADIQEIFQTIMEKSPVKEKVAVMTAGAPGAGKTTWMRHELEAERLKGKNYAYICPDDVCLKSQKRTYEAFLQKNEKTLDVRKEAYRIWRPGSNAATHLILARLIRDHYAFYFGTTSTGARTGDYFKFLKSQGYRIRLLHVSAPDDVRWKSIQERDKTFVQTTEEDIRNKGRELPLRIMDAFLKYADEIVFAYRGAVNENVIYAARWNRMDNGGEKIGTIEILSEPHYQQIKAIHNAVVLSEAVKKPELVWEQTVEKYSDIKR